ncbi:hypothetical protein [Microbacterium sp.]|uniref:hypothetical protein n=1 Tax=Microbacterium sp. TaxID=51671 RepID=UPI0039E4201B
MWTRKHRDLRALGDWTFELRGDELADLRRDGRPVLRSIRAVVRDRDWDTAPLVVDRVHATDATLTLHVRSDGLGSSFRGVVRAEARGDRFVVTADLESAQPFDTNRTGLVVLHPPRIAGAAIDVLHGDGTTERTVFPVAISPHQPVFDIAGLAWQHDGLSVAVRFDGDVFEMEDQRNWTDASYKTYSRPLALPFPYRVDAGERIVQTVTVRAVAVAGGAGRPGDGPAVTVRAGTGRPDTVPAGAVAGGATPAAPEAVISLTPGGAFPAVSVGVATAPAPAPVAGAPAPGSTRLVELDLAWVGWPAALARAAGAGLPLDVRLVIADADPAGSVATAAAALARHGIARVAAFWPTGPAQHVSDAAATALLRAALAEAGIRPTVVGGARSHFTELNREQHRLPADLDGIVFSVTPLFHSLDTEQLVESVAMQRLVAGQAVGIAAGRPVHIGPITLRPHFNNVATTPAPLPATDDLSGGYGPELEDADDPRHDAPELAAWTIASAAALAVPGVASLSYFEEWGPRGIRTSEGRDRPVAAAVRALAGLDGAELLHGASPDGLVWAVGARRPDGAETVLAANLDAAARTVEIATPNATPDATPDGRRRIHLAPGTWATLN